LQTEAVVRGTSLHTEKGNKAMKCETCRFFVPTEMVVYGDCHRYPPDDNGWPVVRKDDFCGEYQPKDAPDDIYIMRDGIYNEAPEM